MHHAKLKIPDSVGIKQLNDFPRISAILKFKAWTWVSAFAPNNSVSYKNFISKAVFYCGTWCHFRKWQFWWEKNKESRSTVSVFSNHRQTINFPIIAKLTTGGYFGNPYFVRIDLFCTIFHLWKFNNKITRAYYEYRIKIQQFKIKN